MFDSYPSNKLTFKRWPVPQTTSFISFHIYIYWDWGGGGGVGGIFYAIPTPYAKRQNDRNELCKGM